MKVILDNIKYVAENGKEIFFEKLECEIPDTATTDEKIIEEVTKYVAQKVESKESE